MSDLPLSPVVLPQTHAATRNFDESAARATAQKLEASFLAEMLKHTGLGEGSGAFSGGVGEEQFASFLREEHAKLMAARGGIGLADTIFQAMCREGQE